MKTPLLRSSLAAFGLLCLHFSTTYAQALSAGAIAFTGFNADGNDHLAFVALVNIPANTIIFFDDNEWDGSSFSNNESVFTWTAPSGGVNAGTVIRINNIGSGTIGTTSGSVAFSNSNNRGLSNDDEVVYAYVGSRSSPTFLTAVANDGFTNANGSLTNTGLTAGNTALNLGALDADLDIAAYTGSRNNQTSFAAYRTIINNPNANWIFQDASSDQSNDDTAPDIPFSTTSFTLASFAPTLTENSATLFLSLPASGSGAVSGVISDPTDPARTIGIDFTIADSDTPVGSLTVTATSSNTSVVPNANLNLTGTGANRNLKITPAAVGYATITVTVSDGTNNSAYTINYAASAAATTPATTRFHTGASDGSTAIATAAGADFMFVADDEDQTIRLYDRTDSGLPLAAFDFTSVLSLSPTTQEVDIESATRLGNAIYWMGSHGNNTDGQERNNRERIFRTTVSGSGAATTLTFDGYYPHLESDLAAWDNANGHGLGAGFLGLAASAANGVSPEQNSGFNIEGLTFAPDGTTAYVAFRAPLEPTGSRTNALIVPISNFTSLPASNGGTAGSAVFGAPIFLNLDGRGIRSIEKNAANEYVLIAGPTGAASGMAPNDFRLYTWTGNALDAPVLHNANLTALNANGSFEGIVEVPDNLDNLSTLQLIVDNGDAIWYNDGQISKDLTQTNFQKFRSDVVVLNSCLVAASVPSGGSVTCNDLGGSIAFSAVVDNETPSATYQWQRSADGGMTWVNISANLDQPHATYSGFTTLSLTISLAASSGQTLQGYRYRIVVTDGVACTVPSGAATLHITSGCNLPIQLLDFTVKAIHPDVLLQWSTASEQNNAYFSIQRSRDGIRWEEIGQQEGAGNASQVLHYAFTDRQPGVGIYYYRLQQIDFDQAFSFSPVRVVEIADDPLVRIHLFPNPASEHVRLALNQPTAGTYQVEVYNALGQRLASNVTEVRTGETAQLDVRHWASGTYLLLLRETGTNQVFSQLWYKR